MKRISLMFILGAVLVPVSGYSELSMVECVALKQIIEEYAVTKPLKEMSGNGSGNIGLSDKATPEEIAEAERQAEKIQAAYEKRKLEVEADNKEAQAFNEEMKRKRQAVEKVYSDNACEEHFEDLLSTLGVKLGDEQEGD